ncbi:Uncharacterized protein FWK35_00000081 [Aphis craccivora]|uniref:Uncharacterized protein n=1 Tax=Aphis craccivora TaxID=307492 RepID=A0A6G0ZP47_APHCR|nr:Uncharacterized protein FWK35_00000081 [Aphis craccivora]
MHVYVNFRYYALKSEPCIEVLNLNPMIVNHFERSDECIDFLMMCVFFCFVSVYSITFRFNISISNFGDSERSDECIDFTMMCFFLCVYHLVLEHR